MQVRSLLSLFVDIETTDRSNAFYEKFNTRYKAGQILGVCLYRACLKSGFATKILDGAHADVSLHSTASTSHVLLELTSVLSTSKLYCCTHNG